MTRDEARQVLLLHRPWAAEPADAEMSAALALVQNDTELRAWFEQHCARQLALRDSLRAQTPPEAFREQIVSECRARSRSSSRRRWVTAAALVLLAVAFEAWWLFGEPRATEEISFAAFERRMSREALRLYRMDLETADQEQIRAFLAARQSPANYVLPAGMRAVTATGCLATKWQGQPVSMICFRTGQPLAAGQTSDLFLFVIAAGAVPDEPVTATPTFAQVNRLAVARWRADGNTYLLATEHSVAELRKNL